MKDVGWDGGSVCVLGIVWRGGERWGVLSPSESVMHGLAFTGGMRNFEFSLNT